MGAAFTTGVDIVNRALQHVGGLRIASFTDTSKNAQEMAFAYDKLRQAELRRSVWRFATRRAALRPFTATTKRFIAPAWSSGSVAYSVGAIVQDTNGVYWICMVAHTSTTSNGPGSYQAGQPQNWQQYFGPITGDVYNPPAGGYYAGEIVYSAGTPDAWYISLQNNNTAALTVTSSWTLLANSGTTDQPIYLLAPVGPGVTIGGQARNIFWLPNGYLRVAPQDPRTANTSNLTTTAGLRFTDWEFEQGYIVSASTGPILLRFVGDLQDVTQMDPLFCEALSARLGYELCEMLTQSPQKLQAISAAYMEFMKQAQTVNRIEIASTEPPEEMYDLAIASRQSMPMGGPQSSPETAE
jgi:hypothetical protein